MAEKGCNTWAFMVRTGVSDSLGRARTTLTIYTSGAQTLRAYKTLKTLRQPVVEALTVQKETLSLGTT